MEIKLNCLGYEAKITSFKITCDIPSKSSQEIFSSNKILCSFKMKKFNSKIIIMFIHPLYSDCLKYEKRALIMQNCVKVFQVSFSKFLYFNL